MNNFNHISYILDNLPFKIYIVDDNYMIKYANKSFRNVLNSYYGISGSDFSSVCLYDIIDTTEGKNEWFYYIKDAFEGKVINKREVYQVMSELNIYNEHLIYRYIYDNKMYVIIMYRVLPPTQDFIALNKELKHSNTMLENFAYTTAHDMRTPIRTLHGLVSRLTKELNVLNIKTSKIQKISDLIQSNTVRLSNIVDGALSYSKLNYYHNDDYNECYLIDVINEALELIEHKECKIDIDKSVNGVKVYAIGNQLIQLFQNLIQNGIKFNDKKLKIISIYYKSDKYYHIIYVKDNGNGISEDQKYNIFKLFHQLDSKKSGSGIGLAISDKIVRNHKGKITFKSILNTETIFEIKLKKMI